MRVAGFEGPLASLPEKQGKKTSQEKITTAFGKQDRLTVFPPNW